MALMAERVDSVRTWETFGVVSLLLTAVIWTAFRDSGASTPARANAQRAERVHWNRDRLRLALCYAALGFGYIIPATFLPAMAHRYISNPAVFGWAWPVFGAAAALSTWAASRWLHAMDNRRLWAISYVLMAIGVVLPALWPALPAILIAALLVGGTFMVVTMLGLREARAVAGEQATGFIAAITAAFAVAQIIGPVVVSAVVHLHDGLAAALAAAALVLLVAAFALWRSAKPGRDLA
jgi:predicted MFS family arabinose efflux permease